MDGLKLDNTALIRAIRSAASEDIRRGLLAVLFEANRGLVAQQARRFAFGGVEIDDLMQAGFLALNAAAVSFDESKGSFANWLVLHLTDAFCECHRQCSNVTISENVRSSVIRFLRFQGAGLSDAEIAVEMGVTLAALDEIKQVAASLSAASLDAPVVDDGDGLTMGDTIGDGGAAADAVIDEIEAAEMVEAVQSALDGLPVEEAEAVRSIDLQGHTHAETAERMQTTTTAVRSLRVKAFRRLRRDRRLKSFMYGDAVRGCGLQCFRESGMSSTERVALRMMGY